MKLDYISNINAYGENVVRLYDFNKSQAVKFRKTIQQFIVSNNKQLELITVKYIKARNCILTLCISEEDEGMMTTDDFTFFCNLTKKGYEQMVTLLEPFCNKETKGHQWLYDVDNQIDFLFSPAGTW